MLMCRQGWQMTQIFKSTEQIFGSQLLIHRYRPFCIFSFVCSCPNMMSFLFASICSVLLACCYGMLTMPVTTIETDNTAKRGTTDANAGIFRGFPTSLTYSYYAYDNVAGGNLAKSGTGLANSGSRTFFGGSTEILETDFIQSDIATGNKAVSRSGSGAISGVERAFNNIDESYIYLEGGALYNLGGVRDATTPGSSVVSGIKTSVQDIDDSYFVNYGVTSSNYARNKGEGDANSGIENAFGVVDDTAIIGLSVSILNTARAADGSAISGVKNSFSVVEDSTIGLSNIASDNVAEASGEPAVAGVENTFGDVFGTFPTGGVFITTEDAAYGNYAKNEDGGTSVAGVETQIQSAKRANIDLNSAAGYNEAVSEGSGSTPSDAVAGVQLVTGELEASNVNLDAYAIENTAINTHDSAQGGGNDATAGVRVVVESMYDSNLNVDAFSFGNKATSVNGDAVAGNSVEVLYADYYSDVDVDSQAVLNQATSTNGNAVINSNIYVQQATDPVIPCSLFVPCGP
eukprot:TRINITY_DN5994_c0_g1_i3.p3 TRINITY_DN5994_c0_g1~~TRINITY_DN5994_c0_g1_i3.p3  ORF type:complete len:517 (+),score=92.35 TRINITY_DN5994_c0_g1_i3:3337-4887(+)